MWIKLLAWLALFQLLVGAQTKRLGKIFGGQTATIGEYPFLVNLRRGYSFKCGGALISSSCVLTAAHCLEQRHQHVQDLYVIAQQQSLFDVIPDSHVRQAWFAWISPQYSPSSLDADIAVIKLRRPFDISGNASIIPVDFNALPAHVNLTIVGWGLTSQGFNPNQSLQAANISLVPQRVCVKRLSKFHPITNNMFCALGENSTDACCGDSGGPVLFGGRTVGVVSWGYNCGKGWPGVYTRLSSSAMSWFLKSFLERHCP